MSTTVIGCEITLHGLHICDNTSLPLLVKFFFPLLFPFIPRPTLQAERRLADSRGDRLSDSHFVWPTYPLTGRAECRNALKDNPTLRADHISNLPDGIFNPALVFDKGGFSSTLQLNSTLSVRDHAANRCLLKPGW